MTLQPHQAEDATLKTPGAEWRAKGEPDPHGSRYDCERAALCMGNLTDEELANGVFLNGDGTHGRAPIADVVAGRAFWPIAWLTAAKDRIRWLSRKLAEATELHAEHTAAARKLGYANITSALAALERRQGEPARTTLAVPENWPDRTFQVGDKVLLPGLRKSGVVKHVGTQQIKRYHVMTSETQGGMFAGFELEPDDGATKEPQC